MSTQNPDRKTIIVRAAAAVALVYCLIAFTPLKTTIPGYPDARSRKMAVQNAIRIDSLETLISRWELYSENLRRVVDGHPTVTVDSIVRKAREGLSEEEKASLEVSDSLLRLEVLDELQFQLSNTASRRQLPIEDMHFFSPLKGAVSRGFDPVLHPAADIVAPANSVVKSVLDGTIVFAGWNDESGYTMVIQHSQDILSVYKHNLKLLKTAGDKVSAGTSIAIVGGNSGVMEGDHLHFELWHEGDAIDPLTYISL